MTTTGTVLIKYELDKLQPGETHFVRHATVSCIRNHLKHLQYHHQLLRDIKLSIWHSGGGVTFRRVQ